MLTVVEVDQAVVGAAVVVSMMSIEVAMDQTSVVVLRILMLILKMLMEVEMQQEIDQTAAMVLQMLWEVEMDQMVVAAALSMAFRTQKVRHFRSRV
ncbi:hypothetical protein MKW92_041836 [Papaver armeniacum]|nr:hypothetical protein MKW92_041836 [Papaver armeniacum]